MEDKTFIIFKVKKGDEFRNYRFAGLNELERCGLKVDYDHYDLIYKSSYKGSSADPMEILEELFEIFNMNHPKDYNSSSLSVSDIIYLADSFYFCDSVGWIKLDSKEQEEIVDVEDVEDILADFLGICVTAIRVWSDDSLTLLNNFDVEYILLEKESNLYMSFLGKHKGHYIYQN